MNLPEYCLDTHPLVWYFTGQKTLSRRAKIILDQIFAGQITCYIPSIVLLEAYHVSLKNAEFIFSEFFRRIRLRNIIVVPLDRQVLQSCFILDKNLEIHDRIIAATSLASNSILVTKDRSLTKTAKVKTFW